MTFLVDDGLSGWAADVSFMEGRSPVGSQLRKRVSVGLFAFVGAVALATAERFADLEQPVLPAVPPPVTTAAASAVDRVPHAIYRYSIVPGGVWSTQDVFDAVARDPIVAAHYRTVNLGRVRVETLPRSRAAFVSYRQGDRVGWTQRPVRLEAGERILTDGVTTIRARCGNLVSHQEVADASGERTDHEAPGERIDPDTLDDIEPAQPVASRPEVVEVMAGASVGGLLPLAPIPAVFGQPATTPVGTTTGTSPSGVGSSVLIPSLGVGAIALPGGASVTTSPSGATDSTSGPQLPGSNLVVPPDDTGQPGGGTPSTGSNPDGTGPPSTQLPGGPTTPPVAGGGGPPDDPTVGSGPGGGDSGPGGGTGAGGTGPGGAPGPVTSGGFEATVPEPSMWWLVACGVAAWWVYRRKPVDDQQPSQTHLLVVDGDDSLSSFESEHADQGARAHVRSDNGSKPS